MGLGETQVFQDEKSRLANTTVARIVAAKGSLNDPETKKECCRKLQKLNATLKDRVAAVDAAMARDAMKGGVTGLGCDNRKLIAVLCSHRCGGATPGDVPGDLSARGRAGLAPARPRAEHGPGDDGDRTCWRRSWRPVRRAAPGRAAAARAVLPIHGARPRRLNRSEP